jgi:hypothetical protein
MSDLGAPSCKDTSKNLFVISLSAIRTELQRKGNVWIDERKKPQNIFFLVLGLPDPEPDPYSEEWIRILVFSHKGVKRTEIMLAK